MATFLKPVDLERTLRSSAIVRELQADSTVDVAAMLVALADVESSYQLDAIGDKGSSYGLWQINSKVWTFDAGRLGDLNYQIEAMAPVFEQANAAVQKALGILRARGAANPEGESSAHLAPGAALAIRRPQASEEQPVWYSIIWQYGIGSLTAPLTSFAFLNWIAETWDTGRDGFPAYRKAHGRNIGATYYKRQAKVLKDYAFYIDPISGVQGETGAEAGRADFYEDVVKKTGTDIADLPRKALPYLPLLAFAAALGFAAWSTARRTVTG